MVFESAEQFRKAVADYSCEYKIRLKLKPNDKKRVRVKCEDKKCKWLLFASIDKDSGDFIVKNYYPVHVCPQSTKNKLCTSKFVAEKFKDEITCQPYIRLWEIQELVRKKFGLYVGRTVCHRAKKRVIKDFLGDWKMEFSRLCDYADMIKHTNPGTSCWVRTDRESQPGKTLFVYIYVCFDALKRGWLEGCRKIIGFDGCFLKGSCKGELLVAVGRNGNQQMFPIAWAVVDTETKHSWSFFLNYLIEDLNLGTGHGLTVMSDMQKGLVPALCELLPDSEQRRCARHIWSNWHQIWSGEERRNQFWRCAKSSFEVKFEDEMDKLNKLGNKICEDLLHYEKTTWCKAYFKEHSKCDIVENNMCETFNSWILVARHKAIITMLEEIRHKIMDRNIAMRQFAETWISDISPMARLVLEENKDLARLCEVRFNGDIGYEILDGQYRHIVDIRKKTCTCRIWQLRGIPCQHAVLAYQHKGIEPEHEVVHWYRKETFLKAYNHFLQPIPNMKMWPHTSGVVIEPPEPKVMPGRPPKCRRKAKNEPRKKYGKLSKRGVKMTCSLCHQVGHNKKACPTMAGIGQPGGYPNRQPSSSQPSVFSQPSSSSQPPLFRQPSSSSQPPVFSHQGSSMCIDSSAVRREQQPAKNRGTCRGTSRGIGRGRGTGRGTGRGIGRGTRGVSSQQPDQPRAMGDSISTGRQNRTKTVGFGIYTNASGSQTFNPSTSGERVITPGVYKDAAPTNIDIGYKPRGLKWNGGDAVTASQLQCISQSKKNKRGTSSAPRNA